MDQEYIEELRAFLKQHLKTTKFSDLVDCSRPFRMIKQSEHDLVQIQYLRLISRDPRVVRELAEAKQNQMVPYLKEMQHFYLVQTLTTPVQLLLVELLQTLKRLYGPAYKSVVGGMSTQLEVVFSNYVHNIQFLNEVLVEYLVMDNLGLDKVLEYLVNPQCKQNKVRALIVVQQNISDFMKHSARNVFRYIFQLGVQIQRQEEKEQQEKKQQEREQQDRKQQQNVFVQYLSVLQQIINSNQADYGAIQQELGVLQVMLDGLVDADIIAQMIMVQLMFQLAQDAGLNQELYGNNIEAVLLLLTDYENSLRLETMNINQQQGIQQEVLQQLFRLLRQYYQLDCQRSDIKYVLDVEVLQTFVQIEEVADIDEYVGLVEQYVANFSQQYLGRFQQVFSEKGMALSNIHLMQPGQQPLNNHLQVLQKVGKGAFGTVYLCHDQKAGPGSSPKVALKEIEDRNVWEIECRILSNLKHRNIVGYKESFRQDHKHYLAMDYIEGLSLAQLIKFSKQAERHSNRHWRLLDIRKIALQLVQAVWFLHQNRIVHRDLNPTNMMIDQECNLFLIDFGFALDRTNHSQPMYNSNPAKQKEFVGTLTYTAPEVINRTECDSRMDIWSLGCVLYELLYRKQAFQQENNVLQLAKEIFDGNIRFDELDHDLFPAEQHGFAQKLLGLTRRCLVKEPTERVSIGEMVGVLGGEMMHLHMEQQHHDQELLGLCRLGQAIGARLEHGQHYSQSQKEADILRVIMGLYLNNDPHCWEQFRNVLARKKTLVFIHDTIYQKEYYDLYQYLQ